MSGGHRHGGPGDSAEHGHEHPHAHGQHGHAHDLSADADRRYLTFAFLLIAGFMAFEVVAGILAHSLALLSDAAHMLTDAGALALSLPVIRFVQRPGGETLTYGRRRAEVLSGQANGAVLLVLGVLVTYESISRLITPPDVAGMTVTVAAAFGVAVNIAANLSLTQGAPPSADEAKSSAFILNLSVSGAAIRTPLRLVVGDQVKLAFAFGPQVNVQARVVRTTPTDRDYSAGLEFVHLPSEALTNLQTYLAHTGGQTAIQALW
jgi:Co/Zn/Cd efflux system component